MAHVIIDAGWAYNESGHASAHFMDQLLRSNLGGSVRELFIERPVLVDRLAAPARCMDQHCTGENELFNIERL